MTPMLRTALLLGLAATHFPAVAAPASATVAVPVLARIVERGEVISRSDLAVEDRPSAQARGTLSIEAAEGMEAVRRLSAGAVLRTSDLVSPRLVRRGEPVTLTVRNGPLTITTTGRALASAGMGDLVRVVTLSTNRTLDGIVDGPGTVRIAAP